LADKDKPIKDKPIKVKPIKKKQLKLGQLKKADKDKRAHLFIIAISFSLNPTF